jgi:hypothetical protein
MWIRIRSGRKTPPVHLAAIGSEAINHLPGGAVRPCCEIPVTIAQAIAVPKTVASKTTTPVELRRRARAIATMAIEGACARVLHKKCKQVFLSKSSVSIPY